MVLERMKKMNPFFRLFLLCLFAVSGCSAIGYRLGTTLPMDIQTVYIPTFINRTTEPQIEIQSTAIALQEFRKDGSLRISSAESADVVLEVTITSYSLSPLAYSNERSKAAEEMRLIMMAKVVLREMKTKKVRMESIVDGEATFVLSGDLASSKMTVLPKAARDLAHNIVESVVEYWE